MHWQTSPAELISVQTEVTEPGTYLQGWYSGVMDFWDRLKRSDGNICLNPQMSHSSLETGRGTCKTLIQVYFGIRTFLMLLCCLHLKFQVRSHLSWQYQDSQRTHDVVAPSHCYSGGETAVLMESVSSFKNIQMMFHWVFCKTTLNVEHNFLLSYAVISSFWRITKQFKQQHLNLGSFGRLSSFRKQIFPEARM